MPTILIVEDEQDVAYGLELNLLREGYEVLVCGTGEEGLEVARTRALDLVLLDLMLPGISGMEFLRTIRDEGLDTPVVVVSAKVDEVDIVTALRSGAQDYVTKPFLLLELIERIALRIQQTNYGAARALQRPRLVVDLTTRTAEIDGVALSLSPKQLDLLAELIKADGRVLNKNDLLASVWHLPNTVQTHTVDVHVASAQAQAVRTK